MYVECISLGEEGANSRLGGEKRGGDIYFRHLKLVL